MTTKKEFLTNDELINNLKNKNIKFNIISENDAKKFLQENIYYNVISYCENFEKYYYHGEFINKYIDLDFAYLKDLSCIDYEIRIILFTMISNIEHFLKIKIINVIETNNIDCQEVINQFLKDDFQNEKYIHKSIIKVFESEYYKEQKLKYKTDKQSVLQDISLFDFLEIITLGEIIKFYEYLSINYNLKLEKDKIFILREVRKLRNAVYHNTNILSNINSNNYHYKPDTKITQYLKKCGIGREMRKNKLSNYAIRQITYTIYAFNEFVTSKEIRIAITKNLRKIFFKRILLNKSYYTNNGLLISTYNYFRKIINNL